MRREGRRPRILKLFEEGVDYGERENIQGERVATS